MRKIVLVVGARPNFMKIAPLFREIKKSHYFTPILVHTGQHYDREMSEVFFKELSLPSPDIYLGVGSDTQAKQTARIMIKFEKVLSKINADLVIVVGDVNSTLAASLVSTKLRIPIAHVEAGLRSYDRTMPEEINRIVTDKLSDYLFTTSKDAGINLLKEGIDKKKIFFVGNVMIDTLKMLYPKAVGKNTLKKLGLLPQGFALLTLHRPSNVDEKASFEKILKAVRKILIHIPVVFPVHPRSRKQLKHFQLEHYLLDSNLKVVNPLSYLDCLNLMINCKFVLTDSGGMQEETTALSIPCLTLRDNTERPITITLGTNTIVNNDEKKIIYEVNRILNGAYKKGIIPKFWDGNASKRIIEILRERI